MPTRNRLLNPSVWNAVYFWPKENEGPQFLLALRSHSVNNSEHWNFFGGRAEFGENISMAAKRELQEESKLIVPGKFLMSLSDEVNNSILHYFLVKVDSKITPKLNDENTAYRWVDFNEVITLDLHQPTLLFFFKQPYRRMLDQLQTR